MISIVKDHYKYKFYIYQILTFFNKKIHMANAIYNLQVYSDPYCQNKVGAKIPITHSHAIGSSLPIPFEDATVDKINCHIKHVNQHLYIVNQADFGTYYKLTPGTTDIIPYGIYIIIGDTWILPSHKDCYELTFVDSDYQEKFKVNAQVNTDITIGSSPSDQIKILDDKRISGSLLTIKCLESTLQITSQPVGSGVWIGFTYGEVVSGSMFCRIGVHTFFHITNENNKPIVTPTPVIPSSFTVRQRILSPTVKFGYDKPSSPIKSFQPRFDGVPPLLLMANDAPSNENNDSLGTGNDEDDGHLQPYTAKITNMNPSIKDEKDKVVSKNKETERLSSKIDDHTKKSEIQNAPINDEQLPPNEENKELINESENAKSEENKKEEFKDMNTSQDHSNADAPIYQIQVTNAPVPDDSPSPTEKLSGAPTKQLTSVPNVQKVPSEPIKSPDILPNANGNANEEEKEQPHPYNGNQSNANTDSFSNRHNVIKSQINQSDTDPVVPDRRLAETSLGNANDGDVSKLLKKGYRKDIVDAAFSFANNNIEIAQNILYASNRLDDVDEVGIYEITQKIRDMGLQLNKEIVSIAYIASYKQEERALNLLANKYC